MKRNQQNDYQFYILKNILEYTVKLFVRKQWSDAFPTCEHICPLWTPLVSHASVFITLAPYFMLFYLWMACTIHSKFYYGPLLCNIGLFWWWTIIYMCIYFPNWLILFYGHLGMAYFFSPLSTKCTARHKEMGPIQTVQTKHGEHLVCARFCMRAFFFPSRFSVC